jgi:hypothetical protein
MNKIDTKALIVPSATELLSSNDGALVKATVHKLMRLTSGGRRLNSNQATGLAVYALMTDLNPFNNECYWMLGPGEGPIPGVAGYRRKALEYLAVTSGPNDRYFVTHRDALPGEAIYDLDKGDIARHCTLRIQSVSDKWRGELLHTVSKLKEAGLSGKAALAEAKDLVGPEPVWEATAVVDYRENFEGKPTEKRPEGTPDKWDRVERCDKRAEKWAIRKAFPSVILPDISLGGSVDIDPNVIDAIVREVEEERSELPEWGVPRSGKTEEELKESMGFDNKPSGYPSPDPDPDKPDPNEPEPKKDPKKESTQTGDPVTDFWTLSKSLGVDTETANNIAHEAGKDFTKALEILENQYTPKE